MPTVSSNPPCVPQRPLGAGVARTAATVTVRGDVYTPGVLRARVVTAPAEPAWPFGLALASVVAFGAACIAGPALVGPGLCVALLGLAIALIGSRQARS